MAMNNITTNVSTVEKPSQISSAHGKVTGSGGYSPFQPQTYVNIENSIRNMLEMLTKAGTEQSTAAQEIPEELQKMLNEMLKSTFSMENSLSQGIGNMLQGQKASIDQLALLAKLLQQLGIAAENQSITNLPDPIKALLENIIVLADSDGKNLNTAQLNKIALQLLDGKEFQELPKELQSMLLQQFSGTTAPSSQPQNAEGMDLLKQLIQFFLPPKGKDQPAQQANQPQNSNGEANTAKQNANASETANAAKSNTNPSEAQTAKNSQDVTQNSAKDAAKNGQQTSQSQQTAATKGEANIAKETLLQNQLPEGSKNAANRPQAQPNNAAAQQETVQQQAAKNQNVLLQNPKEFVALMKNVSQQMLKTSLFSKENAELLQKFINGEQNLLGHKEIETLQVLLNLTEANIPYSLRQAAAKQDLPDLPKLWAFVQLNNLTKLVNLNEQKLKAAGKHVQEFSNMLKRSLQNESEVSGNQRSIFFMTPLYLGENERSYPTYIHLYHQKEEEDGKDGQKQRETWLRICLLTENVGAVEIIFRLYDEKNLDLRLSFSKAEAVQDFDAYLPEMKEAFETLPFSLADVKVNVIGEK